MEVLIKIAGIAAILASFWVLKALSDQVQANLDQAITQRDRLFWQSVGWLGVIGLLVFWGFMVLVVIFG